MSKPPKTGVVDPWRVVEPLHPPARKPSTKRINLSEIDFDADLTAPKTYSFSSAHGSVEVKARGADNPSAALCVLVQCLFEILEQLDGPDIFQPLHIGFSLAEREWAVPSPVLLAEVLSTTEGYSPRACLYFVGQSYDHGMLRLIKALNVVRKRPGTAGSDILKRGGVVPMLR